MVTMLKSWSFLMIDFCKSVETWLKPWEILAEHGIVIEQGIL
jgi:hypothetical protein